MNALEEQLMEEICDACQNRFRRMGLNCQQRVSGPSLCEFATELLYGIAKFLIQEIDDGEK